MKRFQSYEQFEEGLKKESIPDIDFEKIKTRTIEMDNYKVKTRGKRRVVLVVAVAILTMCFGTVAMAVYNGWQLKNDKGDVVFDYSKLENKEVYKWLDAVTIESNYGIIKKELQESLAPGEMAYFLVTEAYEIDKLCSILQVDGENIFDLEKLRESTITKFKTPQYLPDNYHFEYGKITFKEEGDKEKIGEALYQEAKKAGKDYIIKKEKLTKEAEYITLRYINDDGYRLTIRISQGDNAKSIDTEIETIAKFTLSGKEILYIKHNWYNTDSYLFVDEDAAQKLTYKITNNGTPEEDFYMESEKKCIELSKEEATEMIESFK